jgi:hypothetical protein
MRLKNKQLATRQKWTQEDHERFLAAVDRVHELLYRLEMQAEKKTPKRPSKKQETTNETPEVNA